MATEFKDALAKIKGQATYLNDASESQTKQSVIEPLLESLGWDIGFMPEVRLEVETSKGAVDYALYIGAARLIFLEAKKWSIELRENHEGQLLGYYNATREKPKLLVLTNGQQWRLYLPPTKRHRQLRRFLVINVTKGSYKSMEENFVRFLGRDSISPIGSTQHAARKLFSAIMSREVIRRALSEALDELSTNRDTLGSVLTGLVEQRHPESHPSEDIVQQFISSHIGQINIIHPSKLQPTSFTFQMDDKEKTTKVGGWPDLKHKFCNLIYDLHPDTFGSRIIDFQHNWLSATPDNIQMYEAIGQSGVFVKKKLKGKSISSLCKHLLIRFEHPEDALKIYYS